VSSPGWYDPYRDRRTPRQVERDRAHAEAAWRDDLAAKSTADLEARVAELEGLLQRSLHWDPHLDFSALHRQVRVPPMNLAGLAGPTPEPDWSAFVPATPTGLARMLGSSKRHEEAVRLAERDYAQAVQEHRNSEQIRQDRIEQLRHEHAQRVHEAERAVAEHNAQIDALAAGFAAGDRHAVSQSMTMVLNNSPYPEGFPTERMVGYVPESSLLAVEWYLPPVEVVPATKSYKHVKTRKAVESVARPMKEVRPLYQRVIAQIALRTVREVFESSPDDLISTVVFTGRVRAIDPVTGQWVEPPLITLRATREQFVPLVLDQPKFNPVQCVRKHFFADVSPHPDELIPVEPVMAFDMADPRIVDPVDVLSEIDKRPNLLELAPKEFEEFIQNLFAKMGFDTRLFRAHGDGGVDCVAYDPHPISGGKYIVQAKLYTKTVAPTHVRDLYGTVQHEGATKGIMITTSGYGPDSYKFVGNKPLMLIDGTGLLSLCHQHEIPARILNQGKR